MSRTLNSTVGTVIPLPVLDSFLTLRIVWPQGVTSRFCGADLTIDGVPYEGKLIRAGSLRMSQGASADRVGVVVANVDWQITNLIRLATQNYEARPRAFVGKAFRQPHTDGAWAHQTLFSGVIIAHSTDEVEASSQIYSDIYAAGEIGAVGATRKLCRHKYRGPRCLYTGPLPTCSFDYEGPNGCADHLNQIHFGGFIIKVDKETLTTPPPDNGGGGGGGGGIDDGSSPIYDKYPLDYY